MIVSFEGIDLAGKTTQSRLLQDAIIELGFEAASFAFPSDETPIGQLLRSALRGDVAFPDEAMFALFATNRMEHKTHISAALDRGAIVVCDRYCESEYAYGRARGLDEAWLRALESRMPPSSLVILLDLTYEESMERRSSSYRADLFEADRSYLTHVQREYLRLAQEKSRWLVLDAMLPLDEVHAKIVAAIVPLLRRTR